MFEEEGQPLKKAAIVTDSNSGITQGLAGEMGISVLPMPFTIDGKEYLEGVDLTREVFYEKLKQGADIFTSQPSPESVIELWKGLLEEYESVVHIPMSSGLSGSCQTAAALAQEFGGRVQVVNNQRISVPQKHSVADAVKLAEQGKSAAEIKQILEDAGKESSIYITIATLKYLAKGGRLTPAAAAIGTMLRLKPVLTIQGDKLDSFSKARTMQQAKKTMLEAIHSDIEHRFADVDPGSLRLDVAYTDNEEEGKKFQQELAEAFSGYRLGFLDPLTLSVSCHTGDGALGVAVTRVFHD